MAVKIRVHHGGKSKDVVLSKEQQVLGRSSSAQIHIEDELLSRQHCALYLKQGVATVRDLGSKNGTMLNNNAIEEVHFYLGDKITVGETEIELVKTTMAPEELTLHRKNF